MPEVAEVAHVCAQLRRNILGARIMKVSLQQDKLLFPSVKAADDPEHELANIEKILNGSVVEHVGRHGKYFWIRFKENKVMLMHFGMTGKIHIRGVKSHLVFMENGGDKKVLKDKETKSKYVNTEEVEVKEQIEEWPPKFSKLEMVLNNGNNIDLSFADPRRLGRIRFLTDIANDRDLFEVEPLNRQGPDYSKSGEDIKDFIFGDPDPTNYVEQLTLQDFSTFIIKKKKPIKSILLEQEYFAGIGNWVSDEILYHAHIHPNEVLSNKVSETSPVLERLYNSIKYVCTESVRVEGDVNQFPEDWLMLHRWGKARKKQEKPKVGGHPVDFETIGGRTSCFVPAIQKKL